MSKKIEGTFSLKLDAVTHATDFVIETQNDIDPEEHEALYTELKQALNTAINEFYLNKK